MIKLTELLHSSQEKEKNGLINIDDWRWPELDHLINMGFEYMDDFRLATSRDPKITVYKKKDIDPKTNKTEEFFFVEEPDREQKRFKLFNDVIDYFDAYVQPELDKNI